MIKKKSFFVFLMLGLTLLCATVFAEEGGSAAEEQGIPRVIFWQAFNLFCLLAILFYLLKGKVVSFFKSRHDVVADAIKEASRIKTEAENKHQEYVIKIQELQREQEQVLEQIKKDGEEARRRIIEEAKRLSENIRIEAKRAAETEAEKARAELYDEVLQQALESARSLLVNSVADNDQRRLQKEFVEKIEAVQ